MRSTPLIQASITLAIANNGTHYPPSLIREIRDRNGKSIYQLTPEPKTVFSEAASRGIIEGMQWVVNGKQTPQSTISGTATATFVDCTFKPHVFGKTGTSEGGEDGVDSNSWFISFMRNPEGDPFAIAAVFPRAGMGNRHAGECVKRVWRRMKDYLGWEL